jgi:hypothetical protein
MFLLLVASVVLGAGIGFAVAGPNGGMVGCVFGATFAMLWNSARGSTRLIAPGSVVQHERHTLLCIPTGQFADVELAHDGHHWCDVSACSLCRPADKVACRKRCLDLMNDNHPPGRKSA